MISSSSIAAASFSVIATITLLAGCSAPSGDQQACDMYAKAKQEMVESYNASAAVVNADDDAATRRILFESAYEADNARAATAVLARAKASSTEIIDALDALDELWLRDADEYERLQFEFSNIDLTDACKKLGVTIPPNPTAPAE